MSRIAIPGFCGPYDQAGLPFNSSYGTTYSPLSGQYSQNLFPEKMLQPYNGSDYALIGRPGLLDHLISWATTTINSPVRALWAGQGRLFAVGGTHFYELNPIGGVLTDYGAMAGSTGKGPATISQNQGSAAFALVVWDSSSNKLYTVVGAAMAAQFNATFQEYLDGFQVAIATGASLAVAGNPNQVNTSGFGDATNWTPGPGPTATYATITGGIGLPNALATLNGMLWIFGQQGTEIWYDAGNAGFPLQRYQGGTIGLGCLSPASVVKFYNTIMWVGADTRGYAQVYMARGMNPARVSTPAIEMLIGSNLNYASSSWAHAYQENGHTFYVLNLALITTISQGAIQLTLSYDLTEGVWHVRTYGGSGPAPACLASVPNFGSALYANYVGDWYSGKVLLQSTNFPSDNGAAINYQRFCQYISDMNRVVRHSRFELWGSFGTSAPSLTYSDDYGKTIKAVGFNLAAPGAGSGWPADHPSFQRFYALQLGRSRARTYGVLISDSANLIRIGGALLDIGEGAGQ